jgi:hypothetical protein
MAELNGGQLAILLQNWNHPVIKTFLATAAYGLAIVIYEGGLPVNLNLKRLNYALAHVASPEQMRGLYLYPPEPSPNHPTSMIFERISPEPLSATNITARTSAPELPGILDRIGGEDASANLQNMLDVSNIIDSIGNDSTHVHFQSMSDLITPPPRLPSHTYGTQYTAVTPPVGIKPQTASVNSNGSIMGFAAVVFVAAVSSISAYQTYRHKKAAEAQKLNDAQVIAHLMLQLNEVRISKLDTETALKAAENDLAKSVSDRDQLRKRVSNLTIQHAQLIQALKEAQEESRKNAKLVQETIELLEAQQERVAELERDGKTQTQAYDNLRYELSKVQSTLSVLQDEKSARELEVQEQLQEVSLQKDNLANELQSAHADRMKLRKRLDSLQLATEGLEAHHKQALAALVATRVAAEKKDGAFEAKLAQMQSQIDAVLGMVQQKDSEAEAMRQQTREANIALSIAQERLVQLEKKTTTSGLPEPSIPKTGREADNDGELSHCPSGMSESPSGTTTAEGVNGEQSPMPMTMGYSPSGELNIPNRKRREHWHNHWLTRNMRKGVYSNDKVHKMDLPCFDADFKGIGIALPAENHQDRTLADGKVLEHTMCKHCLQWYTKKDMYDHLKTCKAFWGIAIRCGHCKEIFKYNQAFFVQHVPDCKARSAEENGSEEHYTLANFVADTSTNRTLSSGMQG